MSDILLFLANNNAAALAAQIPIYHDRHLLDLPTFCKDSDFGGTSGYNPRGARSQEQDPTSK